MTTQSSIELGFIKSWDDIEKFYVDLLSYKGWGHVKPVQDLIKHLRALGYDKLLRAGQSVYILVLSRSKNWGLEITNIELELKQLIKTFSVYGMLVRQKLRSLKLKI